MLISIVVPIKIPGKIFLDLKAILMLHNLSLYNQHSSFCFYSTISSSLIHSICLQFIMQFLFNPLYLNFNLKLIIFKI